MILYYVQYKALALAKSPSTAFGSPLLETEVLDSDLVKHILSSRVSFTEWNLTCSQIRNMKSSVALAGLMEEQEHSRKAMEHIQTPRKLKSKSNGDVDDWYTQEEDEDCVQSFEWQTSGRQSYIAGGFSRRIL